MRTRHYYRVVASVPQPGGDLKAMAFGVVAYTEGEAERMVKDDHKGAIIRSVDDKGAVDMIGF